MGVYPLTTPIIISGLCSVCCLLCCVDMPHSRSFNFLSQHHISTLYEILVCFCPLKWSNDCVLWWTGKIPENFWSLQMTQMKKNFPTSPYNVSWSFEDKQRWQKWSQIKRLLLKISNLSVSFNQSERKSPKIRQMLFFRPILLKYWYTN